MKETIQVGKLQFERDGEKITLNNLPFCEISIAGENRDNHFGAKSVGSTEESKLKYLSHKKNGDTLSLSLSSDKVVVDFLLTTYFDNNAIRIEETISNISDSDIVIESVSSFLFGGIAPINDTNKTYLYRFMQSHHGECQPNKHSLKSLGLYEVNSVGQCRIAGNNVGSWSSKEELPQGIIEYKKHFTMFEIESNNSWYYEISDLDKQVYLFLGGANERFGGWSKKLSPNQSYNPVACAICFGDSLDNVVGEMTKYRRHIAGKSVRDEQLPVIFNEYMHLSWDSPCEENTRHYAEIVAKTGVKYYVIDCGWHDEVAGNVIYAYVGKWVQSNVRFPHGVKTTIDYIRSLGLKAGLWIEPEIVGYKCHDMIDYYGEECFLHRHGKKICVMGRLFLDFRKEKVRTYLTQTIHRMIEEYGAEYIKFDYNEDLGIGIDGTDSFGEGLEECSIAYLTWVDEIRSLFPQVLFETCSSGGMRMDYETLKHFSIVSTSDQIDYRRYPYIVSNILSAVLPEQAAVWSYPVANNISSNGKMKLSKEWVEPKNITEDYVVINMVNSFLGRMHLASNIDLLSKKKFALVQEGIEYYNSLSNIKKQALPIFPLGFTNFGRHHISSGLKYKDKIYLAVWNLGGKKEFFIPLQKEIKNLRIAYPKKTLVRVSTTKERIIVKFSATYQACFLEGEQI